MSRLFHLKILPINNRGKNVLVEKVTIPDDWTYNERWFRSSHHFYSCRIIINLLILNDCSIKSSGYWMLRDEHAAEWTRGLDVILQVGQTSDMVPAPEDFPKCGSFVGPDYFLI